MEYSIYDPTLSEALIGDVTDWTLLDDPLARGCTITYLINSRSSDKTGILSAKMERRC